jgi:hypothetical protein
MKVTLQYVALVMSSFAHLSPLNEDLSEIRAIERQRDEIWEMDGNMWEPESRERDAELRRRKLVHEMSLSYNQVVQLHKLYGLMRGISQIVKSLIHS